jgi:hypothetical protein
VKSAEKRGCENTSQSPGSSKQAQNCPRVVTQHDIRETWRRSVEKSFAREAFPWVPQYLPASKNPMRRAGPLAVPFSGAYRPNQDGLFAAPANSFKSLPPVGLPSCVPKRGT